MFPGDGEVELESGRLRSGRIFRFGKRRRTTTRRGSCSMTRGEDYPLVSHFDEVYCHEEEDYQPISEKEEEEAPYTKYEYNIPMTSCTSPEVISINSSPTSQNINTSVPRENIMIGNDIKLLIFNVNGVENPKKH